MDRKLILVVVLIIELTGVFAFYITEVNNRSAVKEVKEDESTHALTIINPNPKSILREIVNYHSIEKPYKKVINHDNITNNNESIENIHKIMDNNEVTESNNVTGIVHIIGKRNTADNGNTYTYNYSSTTKTNLLFDLDEIDTDGINENKNIAENTNNLANIENSNVDRFAKEDKSVILTNAQNVSSNINVTGKLNNKLDNGNENHSKKEKNYVNNNDGLIFANDNTAAEDKSNNDDNDNNVIDDAATHIEFILVVDNEYEYPNDGKEGVNIQDRYFTNGHGFQYFYPHPDNQESSKKPALVGNADKIVNPEPKKAFEVPEKHENREEEKRNTLVAASNVNQERSDTLDTNRSKRSLATLFAVNEKYAPEDLLKNVMDKVSDRAKRSLEIEGTYGMRLTGDKGVVWNDLNDNRVYYNVRDSVKDKYKRIKKSSQDDEIINARIESFYSFLEETPSTGNPKLEKPNVLRPSTENLVSQESSSKDPILEESSTEKKVSIKTTTEKPKPMQPKTKAPKAAKPRIVEPKAEDKIIPETIIEEPNAKETSKSSSNNPILEKSSTEKIVNIKPTTEKSKAMKPKTKAPKPVKSRIVEPKTEDKIISETIIEESKAEETSNLDKTYGMSLTGDQGIVWNDLNGRRVSYHVGVDDEVINEKIEQFKKSLKETTPTKGTPKKAPSKELNIEEPTTNHPKIEPLTEEPIISKPITDEPKTNRPIVIGPSSQQRATKKPTTKEPSTEKHVEPVKTYGMSLTGDHGIVWNDLNGGRMSYHVGEPETDIQEYKLNKTTTKPDIHDILKPTNDEDSVEDDLLKEIDEVLKEVDNILAELGDETEKTKNDTNKVITDKIIHVIEEAFVKQTATLKDNIKDFINDEVARQVEQYFAHNESKPLNNTPSEDKGTEVVEKNEENFDEELSKKRKGCEEKKEKTETSIKIEASNIYGNSVGNANVTNIFVFSTNNIPDVIDTIKPLNNGTSNVIISENGNKKPVEGDIKDEHPINETTTETDGIASTEKPKEPTSEISEETENKETASENVTAMQETTESITGEDKGLNGIAGSDDTETTNDIPVGNEIKDTSTEKIPSKPDIVTEYSGDVSAELNGISEKPNDISDELNGVLNPEESNNISEEPNSNGKDKTSEDLEDEDIKIDVRTGVLQEPNDIPDDLKVNQEEQRDISEELNGVLENEKYGNLKEVRHNISEEIKSNTDNKTMENLEDKEVKIDMRTGSVVEEPNDIPDKLNDNQDEQKDTSEELNGVLEDEKYSNLEKESHNISEAINGNTEVKTSEDLEDKEVKIDVSAGFLEEPNDDNLNDNQTEKSDVSEEVNGVLENEGDGTLEEEPHNISEEINVNEEDKTSEDLKDEKER